MKTFLVIGMFLIGFACFASGPVLKDCTADSATVMQTIDPVMPAIVPEAVVFYELPYAGTIPELGMPIESAELEGYDADIWHPPVLASTLWLSSNCFELMALYDPVDLTGRSCQATSNPGKEYKQFYKAWYDID